MLFDTLTPVTTHFDQLIWVGHHQVELLLRGLQIIAGDDLAIDVFADNIFPGAGFGREHGDAAGHGFGDGQAKAFVAAERGDEGHRFE